LKVSYTVSNVLWALIQEKLDPQTIHNSSVASPTFYKRGQIQYFAFNRAIWFGSSPLNAQNKEDMLDI